MIRPLLFLILAGALAAYTFWIYTRAELPVRNRRWLGAARVAVLVILLALLFDPKLPWGGTPGATGRWLLVDASLSMSAGGDAAGAVATRAGELEAQGWTVVPFGAGHEDGLAPGGFTAVRSELAPSLARAAEAGASEVRVLSDLRLSDPVEVSAALASAPFEVSFEAVASPASNAGVSRFTVADQARVGDAMTAAVEIFAEGVGDSVIVEIREEGRLVASQVAAVPGPGLVERASLELPSPDGEGRIRYTATVRAGPDGFPSDDEAVAYAMAGHRAGGLVVVSLRPDWEPRALLAVLTETTGLPATGYLRVGPDRFAPMGRAVERGAVLDSAAVGAQVSDAALLVVHGLSAGTDAWGRSLPRRSQRLIAFPMDPRGASELGLATGMSVPGEWYASPDLPASAIVGGLSGARFADLPPLSDLLSLDGDGGSGVPLRVQLRGTGPGQPALLLRRSGGQRQAVALASGFWRWAAREGAGRDAYRRLWSAVAGWVLAQDPRVAAQEAQPESWVVQRGEPVRWRLPGVPGDSVRLVLSSEGAVVMDTVLEVGGAASAGVLDPGTYAFRAEAGGESAGEGRFDVEARTEEMRPPARTPEAAVDAEAAVATGVRGGMPLRTSPWPYLLLLTLLCLEWVGRRRVGLR